MKGVAKRDLMLIFSMLIGNRNDMYKRIFTLLDGNRLAKSGVSCSPLVCRVRGTVENVFSERRATRSGIYRAKRS